MTNRRGYDESRLRRCPLFTPVRSLLSTSLIIRAANPDRWLARKVSTAVRFLVLSLRKAHDMAFTTMSSRSLIRISQTARVRSGAPGSLLAFNGTVLTSAARRFQRSREWAQEWINWSLIFPVSQAGPAI